MEGQGGGRPPGPRHRSLLIKGTGHRIPAAGTGSTQGGTAAYPGKSFFASGQSNDHVRKLGAQLVKKGYGAHYLTGPGPRWTEADRRNVEAFQRAQGWSGSAADGYPGPETWRRLFA